jgi:hypothetical protein
MNSRLINGKIALTLILLSGLLIAFACTKSELPYRFIPADGVLILLAVVGVIASLFRLYKKSRYRQRFRFFIYLAVLSAVGFLTHSYFPDGAAQLSQTVFYYSIYNSVMSVLMLISTPVIYENIDPISNIFYLFDGI